METITVNRCSIHAEKSASGKALITVHEAGENFVPPCKGIMDSFGDMCYETETATIYVRG